MSGTEEKQPLDTSDDTNPSPTDRTPLTYPAQRIARCIMRFLLMVLYLLFLYMEPSSDFSVSTIANSDDGMHFGVLRSCAGSACTELLQGQESDQHAVGTFAQAFLAVGALVISGFICNFLSLLRADAPKEKTHGIRKRGKRWLALTSARCRTLSRIMAYLLVPTILFLGLVLAADVSISTNTYDASLFLGGPLAVASAFYLAIQALMPNVPPSAKRNMSGRLLYWTFFWPCIGMTRLVRLVRRDKKRKSETSNA